LTYAQKQHATQIKQYADDIGRIEKKHADEREKNNELIKQRKKQQHEIENSQLQVLEQSKQLGDIERMKAEYEHLKRDYERMKADASKYYEHMLKNGETLRQYRDAHVNCSVNTKEDIKRAVKHPAATDPPVSHPANNESFSGYSHSLSTPPRLPKMVRSTAPTGSGTSHQRSAMNDATHSDVTDLTADNEIDEVESPRSTQPSKSTAASTSLRHEMHAVSKHQKPQPTAKHHSKSHSRHAGKIGKLSLDQHSQSKREEAAAASKQRRASTSPFDLGMAYDAVNGKPMAKTSRSRNRAVNGNGINAEAEVMTSSSSDAMIRSKQDEKVLEECLSNGNGGSSLLSITAQVLKNHEEIVPDVSSSGDGSIEVNHTATSASVTHETQEVCVLSSTLHKCQHLI
jgi:hypothetical protein